MSIGAFSISLAVKDLARSKAFYEKLGFSAFGGDDAHGYAIMKQGETLIGLFQGMFEDNILTFNPGWDQSAGAVDPFEDIRELHARWGSDGVEVGALNGEAQGPASFTITDPDGNAILVDQHR